MSLSSLFLSLSLSRARRARASRASQISNEPRAAAQSPRGRGLELRSIWRTYDGQRSSASRAAHRHRNQGVIPRSSAAAVTSSGNMALFSAAPPGKRALPPRPVARLSARLRRAAAPPLSEKPRLPRDVRPRKHPHPRRLVISHVSSCLSFIRARRAAAGLLSGVRRPEHGARMPPCLLCFRRRRLSSPRTRRPSAPCPTTEGRPTAASSASARASARARARLFRLFRNGAHGGVRACLNARLGVFVLLCLCVFLSSVVSCLWAFAIAARSAIASALHDAAPARRPLRRPLCHGHVPHEPGRVAVLFVL